MPSRPPTTRLKSPLRRVRWQDLDPAYLRHLIGLACAEDLAGLGLRRRPRRHGDLSSRSLRRTAATARAALVAREAVVACGLRLLPLVLESFGGGVRVRTHVRDGEAVRAGGELATLRGDPRVILAAERTLLNFVQRLTGIATNTRAHVAALGSRRIRLLDTRKTTPGHRFLEKYAVACGGAWNHRLGLFDRAMLKDNHLALLAGSRSPGAAEALAAAVAAARRRLPGEGVEIEVDRLAQLPAALAAGADILLLDNFPLPELRRACATIAGRALIEVSGGVTLSALPRLRRLPIDYVSTGALVHHSVWADLGLDWRP